MEMNQSSSPAAVRRTWRRNNMTHSSATVSSLVVTLGICLVVLATTVQSFTAPQPSLGRSHLSSVKATAKSHPIPTAAATTIFMRQRAVIQLQATSSPGGDKKKRRRRRKQPPPPAGGGSTTEVSSPPPAAAEKISPKETPKTVENVSEEQDMDDFDDDEEIDIASIKEVANFSFDGPIEGVEGATLSPPDVSDSVQAVPSTKAEDGAIPLPDIKDTLRRKEVQAEMARMEEEQEVKQKKINRKDRDALLKLLEQQPYADADESFFEEEEYTTVSALLGERAKPFLGIPTGPLQVGHFIGALVIVLMAFVEYPGFPLTNLPTPLRGALQGGLGVVYAINTVLAVLAAFKAGERGQPAPLWIAKTFSVGGLAYDQLTQLPTTEEVEMAKARKGKRAIKTNKSKKY